MKKNKYLKKPVLREVEIIKTDYSIEVERHIRLPQIPLINAKGKIISENLRNLREVKWHTIPQKREKVPEDLFIRIRQHYFFSDIRKFFGFVF